MSETMETVIVVCVAILFFGGLLAFAVWKAFQREKDFKAFAEANGLEFKGRVEAADFRAENGALSIFDYGQEFEADNVVGGEKDGISYSVADYDAWRVTKTRASDNDPSKEQGSTKFNTPFIARVPNLELPTCDISIRSKYFNFSVFKHDVDMDLTESFYEQYKVRCDDAADEQQVKDLLHVDLQEAIAAHKNVRVELRSGLVLVHRKDLRLSSKGLQAMFDLLHVIATELSKRS